MSIAVPSPGTTGISNYGKLLETLHNFNDREDLATKMPDYIRLLEAELNREVRAAEMGQLATITLLNGVANLPLDFLQARRVVYNGHPIDYVTPDELAVLRGNSAATIKEFSIIGLDIQVAPLSNVDLGLLYYKKIPMLSDYNSTNWVLDSHPDIYLYGTMAFALAERGDDRSLQWKAQFDRAVTALQSFSNEKRYAGTMRATGVTQISGAVC